MILAFLLTTILFIQRIHCLTDIVELKADPDFRSVKLKWRALDMPEGPERPQSFIVKFCEDQAWGKHRCRKKVVDNDYKNKMEHGEKNSDYHTYETSIDGLRIATNYTVEVIPKMEGETVPPQQKARALGGNLLIQTKGFYARAINCLANSSLVEIETGPYFGGKISVEGSTNEKCYTQGDFSSPQTSYQLNVNHSLCGSEMANQSVKTYILVQENLPILTHSTRRFMVICNYVPETFTVRAGVNLPDEKGYGEHLVPVSNEVSEVDASDLFHDKRSLFNSRVAKQVGRALRFSSENEQEDSQKWSHVVLMVVFIVSTIVGVSFAMFHFIRQSRKNNRAGSCTPQDDASTIGSCGSSESGMREVSDTPSECSASIGVPTTTFMDSENEEKPLTTNSDLPSPFKTNAFGTPPQALTPNASTNPILPKAFTKVAINDDGNPNGPENSNAPNLDINESFESMGGLPSLIPGDHCLSVSPGNLENIDAVFDEALNVFQGDNMGINNGYDHFGHIKK